ncbi:Uncharacterised protein [Helicobacter fennelliae]|uniref:Uncharacterized protein n=1 Tax=Helicobacter fennelliae TaxID=215 RepID=A0A2X3EN76_9HELI|nr:hypothetical protein [Helicobacter fennelliae]SQC36467.1 Uncharacterised protein [Helicobacter fennelliae]
MIKKETFNYNLLTQTPDKIFYIIIMNFVSIGFSIGIIWLFFMIKNHIIMNLFPLSSSFFEVFTSICLTALCIFVCVLFLGVNFLRASLCLFLWLIFILIYGYLSPFLDFGFEWGWLLVWFGWVLIILPSILLVFEKIPLNIFVWNAILINFITFGVNILTYGSWHK